MESRKRIVLLVVALLALGGCATKYRVETPTLTIETSSVRKFGEFEGCWKDDKGHDICVKALGVDRQTASPLEQAAADMFRKYVDLFPIPTED